MNRKEWNKALERELKTLPKAELERINAYYNEIFEDMRESGMREEDIIRSFGQPAAVAEKILADYDAYLSRSESDLKSENQKPGVEDLGKIESQPQEPEPPKSEIKTDGSGYEIYEGAEYDGIKKIDLQASASSVRIVKAEKFRVLLKSNTDTRFSVEAKDGVLTVREKGTSLLKKIGLGLSAKDMIIEAPSLENITFDVMRGMTISGFSLKKVNGKASGGGALVMTGCDTEYLSLSCFGGGVSVTGGCHETVNISSADGGVILKTMSAKKLAVSTAVGDVSLQEVSFSGGASIRTMGGKITGVGIGDGDMDCKTFSGACALTFVGESADSKIDVSSFTGKIDAPSGSSAGRRIKVSTAVAPITVRFSN